MKESEGIEAEKEAEEEFEYYHSLHVIEQVLVHLRWQQLKGHGKKAVKEKVIVKTDKSTYLIEMNSDIREWNIYKDIVTVARNVDKTKEGRILLKALGVRGVAQINYDGKGHHLILFKSSQ